MSEVLRRSMNGEYEEGPSFELPFLEPRITEVEAEAEALVSAEPFETPWRFETPFVGETIGAEAEAMPEVAALSEITAKLKDPLFREALEQLADEAIEAHAAQLSGEYGDRETRDTEAERLLTEHFNPLAAEAEAVLDRFFERLEGYETETLSEIEMERLAAEVMSSGGTRAPAAEHFLGGLLHKARGLVSGAINLAKRGVKGAINLAGKGLAAVGKFALGHLLGPLKTLGKYLLKHVVKYAIGQLPVPLQPIARQLSDRLFRAIGETHDGEFEAEEQSEVEPMPAAPDAGRLEAEFDIHAAQLLLTPDPAEAEHQVEVYGQGGSVRSAVADLDAARTQFMHELSLSHDGAPVQPAMEQFVPAALWPVARTAITIAGRPRVVKFLGNFLGRLIQPVAGPRITGLLAPAIADAGLKIFGLETDPRVVATEALAATVEETLSSLATLPPHIVENETLLEVATRDAFETAAATYFPPSLIRPELREAEETRGMWVRGPADTHRKRYAKYSQTLPVTVTTKAANDIHTFHGASLHDHIRDQMGVPDGQVLKTHARLYHVIPGTKATALARAEGIHPHHLHPLTTHAAGALLGPHAALGRVSPSEFLSSPHRLHVGQRLYYLEPPIGRHHRPHVRLARSEMMIDLPAGEICLWLYLSEPLCQRLSAQLGQLGNVSSAFRLLHPLIIRAAQLLRTVITQRHLPNELRAIGETANLENRVPPWLEQASRPLAAKLEEWASGHIVQYLRANAQEFRHACASHHDGVTLRITMTRVPGLETLRLAAQGRHAAIPRGTAWLRGAPQFAIIALPGYAIR